MASKFAQTDINRVLDCSVCLQRFSQLHTPKILPCTHNICAPCLQGLVAGQKLRCPVCRKRTSVQGGDVNTLITNLPILQLADIQPLSCCQACGKESKTVKCAHCDMVICGQCIDQHTREMLTELNKMLEHLNTWMKKGDLFRGELKANMITIESYSNRQIRQINADYEFLCEKLSVRKNFLLGEITKNMKVINDCYDQTKTALQPSVQGMTSMFRQIQESIPSVDQMALDYVEDTKDVTIGSVEEFRQALSACKKDLPKLYVNTHNETLQKEIDDWGTVKCFHPVDYARKGQLARRLETWYVSGGFQQGMAFPRGVTIDTQSGDMFVINGGKHQVSVFRAQRHFSKSFSSKGNSLGQLDSPCGICINNSHQVVVCDQHNSRCQMFTPSGEFIRQFANRGSGKGELREPADVTVDDNDNMYVTSLQEGCIKVYNKDGVHQNSFGARGGGHAHFRKPYFLKWFNGMCIVCDIETGVQLWSDRGKFIRYIGSQTDQEPLRVPRGVAVDQHGNILVLDMSEGCVKVYTAGGEFVTKFSLSDCTVGKSARDWWCFLTCTPEGAVVVADCESNSLLFY